MLLSLLFNASIIIVYGLVVIHQNVIIYLGPTDRTTGSITENKKHFRIHCNYI